MRQGLCKERSLFWLWGDICVENRAELHHQRHICFGRDAILPLHNQMVMLDRTASSTSQVGEPKRNAPVWPVLAWLAFLRRLGIDLACFVELSQIPTGIQTPIGQRQAQLTKLSRGPEIRAKVAQGAFGLPEEFA